MVNKYVRLNTPLCEFREIPIEEAKAKGAMALFGEKYGDKVRVVQFGDSVELCGGTHVQATGNIGLFKIVSESAVAAGIRRIEATTGAHAENLVENNEDILTTLKNIFNNTPNIVSSISKLVEENESFKKNLDEVMRERAISVKDGILQTKRVVNGINVLSLRGNYQPDIVKDIAFMLKKETNNSVFIAATSINDKPTLTLMYTDDLVSQGMNAGKDIREAAKHIQGGGGGQSFFATAGGKNNDGLSNAYNALVELATSNN